MSTYDCAVWTPRMKGPCVRMKGHETLAWGPDEYKLHRSRHTVSEDTPRMREFARIVNFALDHGLQLSYVEIAAIMGHPNLRSVRQYGPGSRYTKLRQRIYDERGVAPDNHRRSAQQSAVVVSKMKGEF